MFESKFITLETLGKGAFSTVVKVQDRYGEGLWAVKKARVMFDGVKDRFVILLPALPCQEISGGSANESS